MKGGCDYSALAKVDAQLQELLGGRLDAIIDKKSDEAAAALLSKLKKRTPVGKAPTFDGPMIESVEIVPVVQTVKRKKKDGTFTEYNRTVKKKKFTYTRNGEIFKHTGSATAAAPSGGHGAFLTKRSEMTTSSPLRTRRNMPPMWSTATARRRADMCLHWASG